MNQRRWTISCDTGGTFTDVVVADASGFRTLAKALTTRARMADGIEAALRRAADALGLELGRLLADADRFVLATTKATNAIIERQAARTAFVTTRGFPDLLRFREGGKDDPFDFGPSPEPYVPRHLTFEVTERVAADGEVLVSLAEHEVDLLARRLAELEVEAVGVCLLWSIANPAHEQRVGELLAARLPRLSISLSHRVNPIIREYRRASGTVLDASLKPLLQGHLREVHDCLLALGLRSAPQMATSAGGILALDAVVESPLLALDCGPAMAPTAGRAWAASAGVDRDLIVVDTGGTSFDVSLVRGGEVAVTGERWIGARLHGHITGLAAVDVHSIGAGGGSIAWVDAGGLLRVGPHSAGAEPGPACYGRGGTEATVTDAAVVLGYLDAGYFLGGAMRLQTEAARAAVAHVGERIGLGIEDTAAGILTLATEDMVTAIGHITIDQGIDPREATIVAGGGAGGLFVVPVARELGVRSVIVPPLAAGFSACGAQFADVVVERAATFVTRSDAFDRAGVESQVARLRHEVDEVLADLDGESARSHAVLADARYPYQAWELRTPVAAGRPDVERLTGDFHALHRRLFAVANEDEPVEFVSWRVRGTSAPPKPAAAYVPPRDCAAEAAWRRRRAYFAETGFVECDVLIFGTGGPVDRELAGPGIIEHPTTTIVLHPGSRGRIRADGLIQIEATR